MGKTKYKIKQVDAWAECESWTYNNTFVIGEFSTSAKNVKRVFLNNLHNLGIVCKRGKTVVYDNGDYLELCERKTGKPLFCAEVCE